MHLTHTLDFVLLLLGASVAGVMLFNRLRLPGELAYLAIGALIGRAGFGLIPDEASARALAEFGVVFLMFTIGLEFSLPHLLSMKRLVFGLGAAQVGATTLLSLALGGLLGVPLGAALVLGGALAMSSTALLSKLLIDRLELDAPHGRMVMGVLLFQDLAVVPLLVLIPALSQPPDAQLRLLMLAGLKATVLLATVLYFGQRLLGRWFLIVARRRSSQLFMLNVLLVTLGLAWLTDHFGLSLALGAFVAGMLISETEYRYRVEEDIKPFRDVLLGLFLVTVGTFLDGRVIIDHVLLVLGLLVVMLLAKFAVVLAAARVFGATPGNAVRTGLWLCAGGEFGFVLLSQMSANGLGSAVLIQSAVAAVVLSLLVAPFLVQWSNRLVMRFVASEWMLRSMELTRVAAQSLSTERHVIICGYGRTGQLLARFVEQEGVAYVALDLDPDRVREAASAGETVVYGDAARRETLIAAGVARAAAVVVSYADVGSACRVMDLVRELRPDIPVVVRAIEEAQLEKLTREGAAEVVTDIFETSITLASHTMALTGVPLSRVIRRVRDIRSQRYALLRGYFHGRSDAADDPEATLERLHSVALTDGARCIGRSIADLALPDAGAKVSAVRRRGIRALNPEPELVFESGDVVVLLGTPEALASAETRLLQGG
ncbi:CPA2 family monovalent cation:H+ antiporter-2 [Niveibacterium umoris]|uniref:CPA2 family monovalent cation:H+ antiporter-2 n=1 Tax=Niveibacterium umoris TaxID=1193620 RepID=A0A840BK21_9RHOO|nr:monovalent cation:proton antiporter family protein [Niveibacterium umoris]MBB4012764.1 CPA2 family monovalent cation:H+ antiporter-2 [Niveibacterium umoris]